LTARTLLICLAVLAAVAPLRAQEQGGPALIILDVTEDSRQITFAGPMETDDPVLSGRSIEELARGQPLFPPIEGLPDEVWKDKHCTDCHQWTRETLCEQGQFYLSEGGRVGLGKVHPYGGEFKQSLRSWSAQGCN
jgi:hypothetical protein